MTCAEWMDSEYYHNGCIDDFSGSPFAYIPFEDLDKPIAGYYNFGYMSSSYIYNSITYCDANGDYLYSNWLYICYSKEFDEVIKEIEKAYPDKIRI